EQRGEEPRLEREVLLHPAHLDERRARLDAVGGRGDLLESALRHRWPPSADADDGANTPPGCPRRRLRAARTEGRRSGRPPPSCRGSGGGTGSPVEASSGREVSPPSCTGRRCPARCSAPTSAALPCRDGGAFRRPG